MTDERVAAGPGMPRSVRFARRVFAVAGWYGIVVMLPQYFLEARIGRDYPPPIAHPEYFYGFIGVVLTWQALFLLIARDPVRFRPAMIPAILEKFVFAVPCIVLFLQHRLALTTLVAALIDVILFALFIIVYRMTRVTS